MSVEVYLCEKFRHSHERKAFGLFLQEMIDRYKLSQDLYLIIVEPEANTASMDMIILTHRSLILVELKELTRAENSSVSAVTLQGSEKGAWNYFLEDGPKYTVGSATKTTNPYQQAKEHRYKLRDWLTTHSANLPGGPFSSFEAINRIYAWVVISPGFDKEKTHLDLPISEIKSWFKILTLGELGHEVEIALNDNLELTSEQMVNLATQLGATRQQNLQEFVPNYVPPAPVISFFSRPPISKRIVNRQGERKFLCEALGDPQVSIISIGGPGGIGKTHLATWFSTEATNQQFNVLWVECNEREVTQESILTAVADKVEDPYKAAFIHNHGEKLSDRVELALSHLDENPCMLILNDFHKIEEPNELNELFTYIVNRTSNIKVLLTTRIRPAFLDTLGWTPGSVVELSMGGLPYDVARDYLKFESIDDEQLLKLWERTSGNPYAIGLFASILRHSWSVDLRDLPLFEDERTSYWADSLIDTLKGEARSLASKLAVVRTPIRMDLIDKLIYGPVDKKKSLIRDLEDRYIISASDADQYRMHDYVREALISKTSDQDLKKAHLKVGNYFDAMGTHLEDQADKIEAWLQALYHYDRGENWPGILKIADLAYDLLLSRGDRDRSRSAAIQAVKAARALGKNEQTIEWLLIQVKQELELNKLESVGQLLKEIINNAPKTNKKLQGSNKHTWQSLLAQYWVLKGLYHHYEKTHDEELIKDCFSKAMEQASLSANKATIAEVYFQVARIERRFGDYSKAKEHSQAAGNLAKELGDHRLFAKCLSQLGLIHRGEGNLEEAQQLFRLAQDEGKLAGELHGILINDGLLGDILLRSEKYEEAKQVFTKLIEKTKGVGNLLSMRINIGWLIDSLIGTNELHLAELYLAELKTMIDNSEDSIGFAFYLKRAGQIEQKRGNVDSGNQLILQGIAELERSGNRTYICDFEKAIILGPTTRQIPLWGQSE